MVHRNRIVAEPNGTANSAAVRFEVRRSRAERRLESRSGTCRPAGYVNFSFFLFRRTLSAYRALSVFLPRPRTAPPLPLHNYHYHYTTTTTTTTFRCPCLSPRCQYSFLRHRHRRRRDAAPPSFYSETRRVKIKLGAASVASSP